MRMIFRNVMNRAAVSAMLLAVGNLAAFPAHAEKPEWAGKGGKPKAEQRGGGHKQHERGDSTRDDGRHFGQRQQVIVRDYYAQEYRGGHCPPGLAKKNNGCMPPGLAKKWHKGRPLPRDIAYYDLPPQLVVQLGAPPAGHKYVRVAADILLIAVGTSMVVDAITDLGRL